MNYVPLEGIRAKLSSMSFGMDDKYDRLTRKTTTLLLLLGALMIASSRHFGLPISCATTELPNGISQNWVDTLCWISDKKSAPMQIIGNEHSEKNTSFYQCTVETLVFASILLLLPGELWKIVLGQSGYHLKTIFTLAATAKQAVGLQRRTIVEELAKHLEASRRYHRLHWNFDQDLRRRLAHLRFSWSCAEVHRSFYHQNRYFIPIMFVFMKILYVTTIIGIYFVLNYCLGFQYTTFGLPILQKIVFNGTSTFFDERFFPQRTWCKITRAKLGTTGDTWADCVLPINVINNIVFMFLWFWLIIVLLCTIYGLMQTMVEMLPCSTRSFLGHHLQACNLYDIQENAAILGFIGKCPPDLTLMLRLYEIELGNKMVGDIIAQLFLMFQNNQIILDNSIAEHLP